MLGGAPGTGPTSSDSGARRKEAAKPAMTHIHTGR